MLTRQAISPVSFFRRYALVAIPLALIAACLCFVATARLVVHASPEYSAGDATIEECDGTITSISSAGVATCDHGTILTGSTSWTIDSEPLGARFRDLTIHDGKANLVYLNATFPLEQPPQHVRRSQARTLTVGSWPDHYDGGIYSRVNLEADDWACAKNERGRWTCTREVIDD